MALVFNHKGYSHNKSGVMITDPETGEIICNDCGLVLSDKMDDHGREQRYFADSQDSKSRTGPSISLAIHNMGLSTIIGNTNRDASGNLLSIPMKNTIKRLRIWDLRCPTRSSKNKSLGKALNQLILLKDKL